MRQGRKPGRQDILSQEELKLLLSKPDKRERQGFRDYVILLVLSVTGMRKSELISLNISDVKPDSISYRILKKRKKKVYAKQPISESVFKTVVKYVNQEYGDQGEPERPLFRTSGIYGKWKKGRISKIAIDYLIQKYVRLSGIKKRISAHSFRATLLTSCLESGASLSTVRDIANHSNISSTSPYLRSTEEHKQSAIFNFIESLAY